MATYDLSLYNETKEIVRHILRFNPTVPVYRLQKMLAEGNPPRNHSDDYLKKIVTDIRNENIQRIRQMDKEVITAQFAELVEFVIQQLRAIAQEEKIVVDDKSNKMEARIFGQSNRIKALNSIVLNYEKLVGVHMDLGLLERKLGSADVRILDIFKALKYEREQNNRSADVATNDNGGSGSSGENGESQGSPAQIAG